MIVADIAAEIQKLIPSQFSIEFDVTGLQTTFPAPIIDQNSSPTTTVALLPEKIETNTKVIEPSDYSLSSTVVGSENSLLVRAFEKCISTPHEIPFPLLITGASGVGKSHHAKTLWWELRQIYPSDRVKLITGERFLTDFLDHIKTKQGWKFQKKYRNETDVLIVDDISCLKTAKKTQEEFLAALDHFHANKKIIVITLPSMPSDIPGLDPAISSRLTSGLHIHLDAPNTDFRRSFIENNFKKLNLNIETECIELISNSATCFRQIKGYINKINFMFAARTDKITTDEITKYIKLARNVLEFQTPEQILQHSSHKFKIEVKDLISKSRAKNIVTARNYAICIMREKLGLSLQEIGRHVGYRDHSTIRSAIINHRRQLNAG
jgi:chromosomal replication initiator protein